MLARGRMVPVSLASGVISVPSNRIPSRARLKVRDTGSGRVVSAICRNSPSVPQGAEISVKGQLIGQGGVIQNADLLELQTVSPGGSGDPLGSDERPWLLPNTGGGRFRVLKPDWMKGRPATIS